jgi:fatty-acyl-CoA synthase
MTALVTNPEFCLTTFADHLAARLPEYARPLFVRQCRQIVSTGTFKPQKRILARDGFDPGAITDALYFYDRGRNGFVRLDADLSQRIRSGVLRF